jgi:hypothetical protein
MSERKAIQAILQRMRLQISMRRGTKEAFVLKQILEELYIAYDARPAYLDKSVNLDTVTRDARAGLIAGL